MDTGRRSDRSLGRIVAMLVALAILAERAAGGSFPVRWLVLSILRLAEPVACDVVAEETQCEWPCLGEAAGLRYGPADAILLAAHFRALAAALAALLPAARRFPGRSGTISGAARLLAPPAGSAVPRICQAGRANDTS